MREHLSDALPQSPATRDSVVHRALKVIRSFVIHLFKQKDPVGVQSSQIVHLPDTVPEGDLQFVRMILNAHRSVLLQKDGNSRVLATIVDLTHEHLSFIDDKSNLLMETSAVATAVIKNDVITIQFVTGAVYSITLRF